MSDVAVLVSSSDNTQDVLHRVFPSLEYCWPDCPYPVYVGKNTPAFLPSGAVGLYSPASAWQRELANQLEQLTSPYVILLLDDFLFTERVASDRLAGVIGYALRSGLVYLRLKRLERSLVAAAWAGVRAFTRPSLVEAVPRSMPYYSSLQPALWEKSHLLATLGAASDIWAFEHLAVDANRHYAVRRSVLSCIHVVERGRWLPAAPRLFARVGLHFNPGMRGSWPRTTQARVWYGNVKFAAVGYSGLRLRRLARRVCSPGDSAPSVR